jgi:hypothetical protein
MPSANTVAQNPGGSFNPLSSLVQPALPTLAPEAPLAPDAPRESDAI